MKRVDEPKPFVAQVPPLDLTLSRDVAVLTKQIASIKAPSSLAFRGLGWSELEELRSVLDAERVAGIELGDNVLVGDRGVELLCKPTPLAWLRKLVLRRCGLGDDGAVDVARALRSMPRLEELDLGENKVTTDGCRIIAGALQGNLSLLALSLNGNEGLFGELTIAEATGNSSVIEDTPEDPSDPGPATLLATNLERNKVLKYLNLSNCGFGRQAA